MLAEGESVATMAGSPQTLAFVAVTAIYWISAILDLGIGRTRTMVSVLDHELPGHEGRPLAPWRV